MSDLVKYCYRKWKYESNIYIPDYKRSTFTRFRTGLHRLMIEKGRWNRTPREQRVCTCDSLSVQDEKHDIFNCQHTAELRRKYHVDTTKPIS